jgi:predicted nucleic acid-binding protein
VARIFWDTNLFIYLFEKSPRYGKAVLDIYKRMTQRGDQLVTSTLTVGEVLVRPTASGDAGLLNEYRRLFRDPAIGVIAFDFLAAELFARIRQDTSIRPPDAIQLACATAGKADLFITNDDRLSRKALAGIPLVSSLDSAPI